MGRGGTSEFLQYQMNQDPRKRRPLKVERGATLNVSPEAGDPGGTMRLKPSEVPVLLCPKKTMNRSWASPPRASGLPSALPCHLTQPPGAEDPGAQEAMGTGMGVLL